MNGFFLAAVGITQVHGIRCSWLRLDVLPLGNIQKNMENHHFERDNSL